MGKKQFYVPTTVQAVPSKKIGRTSESVTTELLANDMEYIYFYSDTDTVSRVVMLEVHFDAITNATTGNKKVLVNNGSAVEILSLTSPYGDNLVYSYGEPRGYSSSFPSNFEIMRLNVQNISFSDDYALVVKFENYTDVATTDKREVYFTYESEVVNT